MPLIDGVGDSSQIPGARPVRFEAALLAWHAGDSQANAETCDYGNGGAYTEFQAAAFCAGDICVRFQRNEPR
jgi:hypothetical protein